MKQVTKYECSKCHKLFDSEEECKECEAYHVMPEKMQTVCFMDIINSGINNVYSINRETNLDQKYPLLVTIQMKDGKTVDYRIANPQKKATKEDKALEDTLSKFDETINKIFKKR
jgi:hypothetical protein